MKQKTFHEQLRSNMDAYAHFAYAITKNFPKEEIYGITSQLRRSALSVVLNYIEGYARGKGKAHKNFLKISYGSLQESKYLITFAWKEKYISKQDYEKGIQHADEIGAMLWGTISKL